MIRDLHEGHGEDGVLRVSQEEWSPSPHLAGRHQGWWPQALTGSVVSRDWQASGSAHTAPATCSQRG